MINRKKKSLSYDMKKYKKQNKNNSNCKKDNNKMAYSSPKIRRYSKDLIFDLSIKHEEEKGEPLEKNIKAISDLSTENNNNKKTGSSQSDTEIQLPEKNQIKILDEENNKNMNNINIIKNELNGENIISQRKRNSSDNNHNNLEKQEGEKNNSNDEKNKLFLELKDEPENNELNNNSLLGFRHSSYDKYKREREKNKKVYINKRFINFSNIIESLEKKSKKVIENSPKNDDKQNVVKTDYFNELLLNNEEINKKLNNNKENEDTSKDYQKMKDNYIE